MDPGPNPLYQSAFNRNLLRILFHGLRRRWWLLFLGALLGVILGLGIKYTLNNKYEAAAVLLARSPSQGLDQYEMLASRDLFLQAASLVNDWQSKCRDESGKEFSLDQAPFRIQILKEDPKAADPSLKIQFKEGSYELSLETPSKILAYRGYLNVPLQIEGARIVISPKNPTDFSLLKGTWQINSQSPELLYLQFKKYYRLRHYASNQNKVQISYKDASENRALEFLGHIATTLKENLTARHQKSIKKVLKGVDEEIQKLAGEMQGGEQRPPEGKVRDSGHLVKDLASSMNDLKRVNKKRDLLVSLNQSGGFDPEFLMAYGPQKVHEKDSLLYALIFQRDAESNQLNQEGSAKRPGSLAKIQQLNEEILALAKDLFNDEAYQEQKLRSEVRILKGKINRQIKQREQQKSNLPAEMYARIQQDVLLDRYSALLTQQVDLELRLRKLKTEVSFLEAPFIQFRPKNVFRKRNLVIWSMLGFMLAFISLMIATITRPLIRVKEELKLLSKNPVWQVNASGKGKGATWEETARKIRAQAGISEEEVFKALSIFWLKGKPPQEFLEQLLNYFTPADSEGKPILRVYSFNEEAKPANSALADWVVPVGKGDDPLSWLMNVDLEAIRNTPEITLFLLDGGGSYMENFRIMQACELNVIVLPSGKVSKDELIELEEQMDRHGVEQVEYVFES